MDKETIFEEARRIVGAENQNVVYGQYLSSLFSPKLMDRFGLRMTSKSTYDPKINAAISNGFATAAYRFGHSMVQGDIQRIGLTAADSNTSFFPKDAFFNMQHYEAKDGLGLEEVILGLCISLHNHMIVWPLMISLIISSMVVKHLIGFNCKKHSKRKRSWASYLWILETAL
nr:peroxidase mlt-7-like [Lepeophtheirus salmonis]